MANKNTNTNHYGINGQTDNEEQVQNDFGAWLIEQAEKEQARRETDKAAKGGKK